MSALDGFKSKITYENKTIIGAAGIVFAIFFWVLCPSIGLFIALISILPAILLIIPSESIKNSKALGIITGIITAILLFIFIVYFIFVVGDYVSSSWAFEPGYVESMYLASLLQIILALYGLICAFLLTIQTEPNQRKIATSTNIINQNVEKKYDKFCSECGEGLYNNSKFCPSCGTKVDDSED